MNPSVLNPDHDPSPAEIQAAVLERISVIVSNELAELEDAFHNRPLNTVAWISRNLIELAVWTAWCIESRDNALAFYKDSARDSLDALKVAHGVFTVPPEVNLHAERGRLIQQGQKDGVEGLDSLPLRVIEAAGTVGMDRDFKGTNRFLSKFAHPTSLWIMTDREKLEVLRDLIYQGGSENGRDTLRLIEGFLKSRTVRITLRLPPRLTQTVKTQLTVR